MSSTTTQELSGMLELAVAQVHINNLYDNKIQHVGEAIELLKNDSNFHHIKSAINNYQEALKITKHNALTALGNATNKFQKNLDTSNIVDSIKNAKSYINDNGISELETSMQNNQVENLGMSIIDYLQQFASPDNTIQELIDEIKDTNSNIKSAEACSQLDVVQSAIIQKFDNVQSTMEKYIQHVQKIQKETHDFESLNKNTQSQINQGINQQQKHINSILSILSPLLSNGNTLQETFDYDFTNLKNVSSQNKDKNNINLSFDINAANAITQQIAQTAENTILSVSEQQLSNLSAEALDNLYNKVSQLQKNSNVLLFNTENNDQAEYRLKINDFRLKVSNARINKTQSLLSDVEKVDEMVQSNYMEQLLKEIRDIDPIQDLSKQTTDSMSDTDKQLQERVNLNSQLHLLHEKSPSEIFKQMKEIDKRSVMLDDKGNARVSAKGNKLSGNKAQKAYMNAMLAQSMQKTDDFLLFADKIPKSKFVIGTNMMEERKKDKQQLAKKTFLMIANVQKQMALVYASEGKDSVTYKKLKRQLDELTKLSKDLEEVADTDIIKNSKTAFVQGTKDLLGMITKGLSLFGMGGILSGKEMVNEWKKHLIENGNLRYEVANADFAMGASGTNAQSIVNSMGAGAYKEYYNKLGAQDYAKMYIDMSKSVSGGFYTGSNDEHVADIHYFTKQLTLPAKLYGIDNNTLIEQINVWYHDNRATPQQAIQNIFSAIETAKKANIPIGKYLKAVGGFASNLRKNGFNGDNALDILDNLVSMGLRLEDASGVAGTILGAIHNFQQQFSQMAFWGSFTDHATGNLFTEGISGAMTVDMYGNTIDGSYQLVGQKIVEQVKGTTLSLGGDSDSLQTFQLMKSLKGLFGDDRTLSIAANMVKNEDFEALGKLYNDKGGTEQERKAKSDKEMATNLHSMSAELKNSVEQLSPATKMLAIRNASANDLAVFCDENPLVKEMMNKFLVESVEYGIKQIEEGVKEGMKFIEDLTKDQEWLQKLINKAIGDPLLALGTTAISYGISKAILGGGGKLIGMGVKHLWNKFKRPSSSTSANRITNRGNRLKDIGKKITQFAGRHKTKAKAGGIVGGILAATYAYNKFFGDDEDNKETTTVTEENKEIAKNGADVDNISKAFSEGSVFMTMVDKNKNPIGKGGYVKGTYSESLEELAKNSKILKQELENVHKDGTKQGEKDTGETKATLENKKEKQQQAVQNIKDSSKVLNDKLSKEAEKGSTLVGISNMLTRENNSFSNMSALPTVISPPNINDKSKLAEDGVTLNVPLLEDFNITDYEPNARINWVDTVPTHIKNHERFDKDKQDNGLFNMMSTEASTDDNAIPLNGEILDKHSFPKEAAYRLPMAVGNHLQGKEISSDLIPDRYKEGVEGNNENVANDEELKQLWEDSSVASASKQQEDLIKIANGDYSSIENNEQLSDEEKIKLSKSAIETIKFLSAFSANTTLIGVDIEKALKSKDATGAYLRALFRQNGIDFSDEIFKKDPNSQQAVFDYMMKIFKNGRHTLAEILAMCKRQIDLLKQRGVGNKGKGAGNSGKYGGFSKEDLDKITLTKEMEQEIEDSMTKIFDYNDKFKPEDMNQDEYNKKVHKQSYDAIIKYGYMWKQELEKDKNTEQATLNRIARAVTWAEWLKYQEFGEGDTDWNKKWRELAIQDLTAKDGSASNDLKIAYHSNIGIGTANAIQYQIAKVKQRFKKEYAETTTINNIKDYMKAQLILEKKAEIAKKKGKKPSGGGGGTPVLFGSSAQERIIAYAIKYFAEKHPEGGTSGFDNICKSSVDPTISVGFGGWEREASKAFYDFLEAYDPSLAGISKFYNANYESIKADGSIEELRSLLDSQKGREAQIEYYKQYVKSETSLTEYLPDFWNMDARMVLFLLSWINFAPYTMGKHVAEHSINTLEDVYQYFMSDQWLRDFGGNDQGYVDTYKDGWQIRSKEAYEWIMAQDFSKDPVLANMIKQGGTINANNLNLNQLGNLGNNRKTQNWREQYDEQAKAFAEGKMGWNGEAGVKRIAMKPARTYYGTGLLSNEQLSQVKEMEYTPSDNYFKVLKPKLKIRENVENSLRKKQEELKKLRSKIDDERAKNLRESIYKLDVELFMINKAIEQLKATDREIQTGKETQTAYMNIFGRIKKDKSYSDMMNEIKQAMAGIDRISNINLNTKISSNEAIHDVKREEIEGKDKYTIDGAKEKSKPKDDK